MVGELLMLKFVEKDIKVLMEAHFDDHDVILCKLYNEYCKKYDYEYAVWDYYPRGREHGSYFLNDLNSAILEFLSRCEFLK